MKEGSMKNIDSSWEVSITLKGDCIRSPGRVRTNQAKTPEKEGKKIESVLCA